MIAALTLGQAWLYINKTSPVKCVLFYSHLVAEAGHQGTWILKDLPKFTELGSAPTPVWLQTVLSALCYFLSLCNHVFVVLIFSIFLKAI